MSVGEIAAIVAVAITIIVNVVIVGMFVGQRKKQEEFLAAQIDNLKVSFEKEIKSIKEFFNYRLMQVEEGNKKREQFEQEFRGCLSKMEETSKNAHHRLNELREDIEKIRGEL